MIKLLLLTFCVSVYCTDDYSLSDEFIDSINRQQKSWIAGRNFPKNVSRDLSKSLACARFQDESEMRHIPRATFEPHELNVPESFNAKDKWPRCESITEIRNQDACGSCWAISAVQVMTDRYCINSDQQKNHHYATMDPLTCCPECGDCNGGFPYRAFEFWKDKGIVSGGILNTNEGCRPYYVIPGSTPLCKEECEPNYHVSYKDDKKFGKKIYRLNGEEEIKAEVYKNGPLLVGFEVFADFKNYKTGVYKHITGKSVGWHAVKLLGWGVENGQNYWLIANSWGSGWGDNGFFKILRGSNECSIETAEVVAGY